MYGLTGGHVIGADAESRDRGHVTIGCEVSMESHVNSGHVIAVMCVYLVILG